jgi:Zn-dependent protease with chaperone function
MLLLVVVLVLFSGLFADLTAAVAEFDALVLEAAVFFGGVVLAGRLLSAPFDLVTTFVVEEAYGFNEQSLGLWVRDWIVGTLIGAALVVPIGATVVWFVDTVALWPVAAWLLGVVVVVALQVLLPRVILPLFYEFEPLEEGALRAGIDEVFETAGYRTENVYEMNASSRSGHSNAFFSGLGPAKRVVLFDTLTESMDTEAIKSVLAHELAHWREGHIWKFIALSVVRLGLVFATLGALVESGIVYDAVPGAETPYVGLFVGLLVILPINRLSSPVENYFSLQYERDADAYAVEIVGGEPMARALAGWLRTI